MKLQLSGFYVSVLMISATKYFTGAKQQGCDSELAVLIAPRDWPDICVSGIKSCCSDCQKECQEWLTMTRELFWWLCAWIHKEDSVWISPRVQAVLNSRKFVQWLHILHSVFLKALPPASADACFSVDFYCKLEAAGFLLSLLHLLCGHVQCIWG